MQLSVTKRLIYAIYTYNTLAKFIFTVYKLHGTTSKISDDFSSFHRNQFEEKKVKIQHKIALNVSLADG